METEVHELTAGYALDALEHYLIPDQDDGVVAAAKR